MTSLKLMPSSTSRNSDPRRKSSDVSYSSSSTKQPDFESSNIRDQRNSINGSNSSSNLDANIMTLDGYLRNVYGDSPARESSTLLNAEISLLDAAGAIKAIGDDSSSEAVMAPANAMRSRKTVDDVWREIVEGKRKQCKEEAMEEMMTLEDFLVKAGAVEEEEVGARAGLGLGEVKVEVDTERSSGGIFAFGSHSSYMGTPQQSMEVVVGFGNGMDVIGGGRGKRKAILEPLDKAAFQRQRRMIKNRESAARSRERKQAYQVELESIAVRLEEENEQLLKEKAERTRERYKQLMEKVIPVVEKRRPPHLLRRVRSMQW